LDDTTVLWRMEAWECITKVAMRTLLGSAFFASVLLGMGACGSRTGLLSSEVVGVQDSSTSDRGVSPRRDATPVPDALPSIDARPPIDVDRNDCPDPSATFVYVVTSSNELLSFYPPSRTFRTIGTLACPSAPGTSPYSMAVNRRGVAYVLYSDGQLFRASTLTAACTATAFQPGQSGFQVFGMGFSSDQGGPGETLYVAGDAQQGGVNGLAKIDTTTFRLTPISPALPERAELTGTGDGRLFAFYADDSNTASRIGQVDKTTGTISAEDSLQTEQGGGWAFAFWGGSFYLFTGDSGGGGSRVTRYDPNLRQESAYTSSASLIVGAGVSTCAPSE
jgi:hypothetical protein